MNAPAKKVYGKTKYAPIPTPVGGGPLRFLAASCMSSAAATSIVNRAWAASLPGRLSVFSKWEAR